MNKPLTAPARNVPIAVYRIGPVSVNVKFPQRTRSNALRQSNTVLHNIIQARWVASGQLDAQACLARPRSLGSPTGRFVEAVVVNEIDFIEWYFKQRGE